MNQDDKAEVYSSLLKHDKRVRRWRMQLRDVYGDLDFMDSKRLSEIRERIKRIYQEMEE